MATLVYNVELFVPVSENHRIMTIGIGIGLSYLNNGYSVNLCNPFCISLKKKDLTLGGSSKQGFCQNKQELANFQISEFRASGNAKLILYSYVGENLEFNAITSDAIINSAQLINEKGDFRVELKPTYIWICLMLYIDFNFMSKTSYEQNWGEFT